MRGFMVLCLIAAARALPQGYNYPLPGLVGGASSVHQTASGLVGGGAGQGFNGALVGTGFGGGAVGGGLGGGLVDSGHVGGAHLGGAHFGGAHHGGHVFHGAHHGAAHTIVSKHFHLYGAPEETIEDVQQEQVSLGPAHKHYRVVFIKAPTQTHSAAALQIAQAANEEKTVIYVLTKKTDASDIQAAIKQAPQLQTKPEVYFIKYKTPEEAAHAQHTIQAQYDALGGSTHVSDEGIAPVTSVVGSLGHHGGAADGAVVGAGSVGVASTTGTIGSVGPTAGTAYLPPHH